MANEKIARFPVVRYRNGQAMEMTDTLAEEVPVSFEFNGLAYTVRLATPSDLEDLALGLALTEGIITVSSELYRCDIREKQNGFRVLLEVSGEALNKAKEKKAGNISLTNPLSDFYQQTSSRPKALFFTDEQLHAGFSQMEKRQALKDETGATHAAAWMNEKGEVTFIREDVGRHNALDKLIGALAKENRDMALGAVLVTSRASYEMVHKCAVVGVSLLAAVSAPTALAVRLANRVNLTLAGFVREESHTIYTHFHRLQNLG